MNNGQLEAELKWRTERERKLKLPRDVTRSQAKAKDQTTKRELPPDVNPPTVTSPPITFDVVNEASGARCRENRRTKGKEPKKRTKRGIPPINPMTATAAHPTFDVRDERNGGAVKRGKRTKAKEPNEPSETDSEAERKSIVFDGQRMTRSRAKAATADLKSKTKIKAPMSELDVRTQKDRDEVMTNDDPLEGTSTSFDKLSPTLASKPCLTYHHKPPRQGLPSQSRRAELADQ